MNRIATTTIIRGNGRCEAYMNGVVMQEMKRLNERHAAEMRSKDIEIELKRNANHRLLCEKVDSYKKEMYKRSKWQCVKEYICEKVLVVWACMFLIALKLKMIEEVEEDE